MKRTIVMSIAQIACMMAALASLGVDRGLPIWRLALAGCFFGAFVYIETLSSRNPHERGGEE